MLIVWHISCVTVGFILLFEFLAYVSALEITEQKNLEPQCCGVYVSVVILTSLG